MRIDARIRVVFLDALPDAGRADQLLLVAEGHDCSSRGWGAVLQLSNAPMEARAVAGHGPGCSCCRPRQPQAAILTRMFQARARGETVYFRSVVAHLPPQEAGQLRQVLVSDPFVSGCFVLAS